MIVNVSKPDFLNTRPSGRHRRKRCSGGHCINRLHDRHSRTQWEADVP